MRSKADEFKVQGYEIKGRGVQRSRLGDQRLMSSRFKVMRSKFKVMRSSSSSSSRLMRVMRHRSMYKFNIAADVAVTKYMIEESAVGTCVKEQNWS